jgi:hypothetical protein
MSSAASSASPAERQRAGPRSSVLLTGEPQPQPQRFSVASTASNNSTAQELFPRTPRDGALASMDSNHAGGGSPGGGVGKRRSALLLSAEHSSTARLLRGDALGEATQEEQELWDGGVATAALQGPGAGADNALVVLSDDDDDAEA